MKSSIDHLPTKKQRELSIVVDLFHEEFYDALSTGSAEFKKKGRILKIILFGSYARGDWVDEPQTMKGYRSDYDLLIIVNNRKLNDFQRYWSKAKDRLLRHKYIETPVSFVVHSRREVNTALCAGQYFYSDIRREGIVLYELDNEPLAEPKAITPGQAFKIAEAHFQDRLPFAMGLMESVALQTQKQRYKIAAFELHQAVEHAYSALLLTLTNYSPPSHNLAFLRSLAEGQDRRLVDIWPRDQRRYVSWFNTLNEAYVKARYSKHYEISQEALSWLGERTAELHRLVEQICNERLAELAQRANTAPQRAR